MARHGELTRNKHFKKEVIIILPHFYIICQEKSKLCMVFMRLESEFCAKQA